MNALDATKRFEQPMRNHQNRHLVLECIDRFAERPTPFQAGPR
jgi:hypothetical protein